MLLAGGLLGYQIEYMLTDPVITSLEDDLNNTKVNFKLVQAELEDLKKDYELLETNFSSLRSEFLELKNESIALAEYEELLDDYLNISNELSNKEFLLEDTNQSYQNLKEMYVALLIEYNLWVLPESITMNVNNLNISIDLDGTRFEHNRPMTGAVTISYSSGEPFNGNVSLRIRNEFFELSSGTDEFEIFGETVFSISGRFIWGAGRYSIALWEIIDEDGSIIAVYNDLRDYRLYFEVL
jgi:hypothetical protein